ncbi:carboxypeptidase-like regulatory domain-containing protein [Paludibaculum fermentans]|uniref:carboxypeptidase-like regulatory domain-containing protein n=1 Tax=Paludibaculum fermentans TaxID=1473598 RepID=UPI003EC0DC33
MFLVRCAISLFSVVLLAPLASACKCVPSNRKACEGFSKGELVFAGQVERVEPRTVEDLRLRLAAIIGPEAAAKAWTDARLDDQTMLAALKKLLPASTYRHVKRMSGDKLADEFEEATTVRTARVRVTERFHGDVSSVVEIRFGVTSCDVQFEEGRKYLIQTGKEQGSEPLSTGVCDGTVEIEDEARQLAPYRNLISKTAPASVFGFVTQEPQDLQMAFGASQPVRGIGITVRANGTVWQAVTDAKGQYSVDLPGPGSYEVTADIPGLPEAERVRPLELTPGQCRHTNFSAVPFGSIRGRIVGSDGLRIANRLIEAVPVSLPPEARRRDLGMMDEDGTFQFPFLRSGDYRIRTASPGNIDRYGQDGARLEDLPIYYPGVATEEQAAVIHLDPGQTLDGLSFQLPSALPPWWFEGKLTATQADVEDIPIWSLDDALGADQEPSAHSTSNLYGAFQFMGAKGHSYSVFAHYRDASLHYYSTPVKITPENRRSLRLALQSTAPDTDCELCRKYNHLRAAEDSK